MQVPDGILPSAESPPHGASDEAVSVWLLTICWETPRSDNLTHRKQLCWGERPAAACCRGRAWLICSEWCRREFTVQVQQLLLHSYCVFGVSPNQSRFFFAVTVNWISLHLGRNPSVLLIFGIFFSSSERWAAAPGTNSSINKGFMDQSNASQKPVATYRPRAGNRNGHLPWTVVEHTFIYRNTIHIS